MQVRTTGQTYLQPQCSDVPGTIAVSIARPATGRVGADETLASTSTEMQTAMTHLRSVGRRDKIKHHAGQCRLVRDKLLQLEKGPTVATATFRLRSLFLVRAVPDAAQIFDGERRVALSGCCDKRFGNTMIGVPLEALFTPRQPV